MSDNGAGASDKVDRHDAARVEVPEAFASITSMRTNDHGLDNMNTIDFAVAKKDAGPTTPTDRDGRIQKNQDEQSIEELPKAVSSIESSSSGEE